MMEEKYIEHYSDIELSVRKMFEYGDIKQYDIDVTSYKDVTVKEFIDAYMAKIRQAKTGRIAYIDGTEETMEDAQKGRTLCTYLDDYISSDHIYGFTDRFVRFASLKHEHSHYTDMENVILFISSKEGD